MPKNQTLDEFYSTFREEVLCASDTETSGWTTEDFLTNVMMEYLEEAGEVTDPVICPFRGYGLQMNAYAISEDCESVDIFVSIYSESDRPRSVSQADIDAAIKRAIQLYHKAINDLYTAFQKDNDTYEFAITLHQNKDNITKEISSGSAAVSNTGHMRDPDAYLLISVCGCVVKLSGILTVYISLGKI